MARFLTDGTLVETPIEWVFDDGGRADAGYKGFTGDCVIRSIAIATETPYKEVYDAIHKIAKDKPLKGQKSASPRNGVFRPHYEAYLKTLGWEWIPTMKIGQGCKVHLRASELPSGRLIASVTKHLCAVIDGVIHDTHDPSRDGKRCVYGVYVPREDAAKARQFLEVV